MVRDSAGQPKLDKSRHRGRIDALQAAIIALGLGERSLAKGRGMIYHGSVEAQAEQKTIQTTVEG